MMLESGGAKPPSKPLSRIVEEAVRLAPDELPRTTTSWLAGHDALKHLQQTLAAEDLSDLCGMLASNRVACLKHLKEVGVSALGDRQKLANTLARDRREGFIWLPGEPPPAAPVKAKQHAPPTKALPELEAMMTTTIPRGAPTQPTTSSAAAPSAYPVRDAACDVDDDDVMRSLRDGRPASAWQQARALRDSPAAWLLRGRALVAMGALEPAVAAYARVIAHGAAPAKAAASAEEAVAADGSGGTSAAGGGGRATDASDARSDARSDASGDTVCDAAGDAARDESIARLVSAARAEVRRATEIVIFVDGLGATKRWCYLALSTCPLCNDEFAICL